MRLSFSFILCSVLVYATVYCSDVCAEEFPEGKIGPNNANEETCSVDYLKRKGKLPENYEWIEASPLCSETMNKTLREFKEAISFNMQDTLAAESNCIMGQFEKDDTMDVLLKIVTIIDNRYGRIHADLLKAARDEAKERMKAAANACGLEDESKLISCFDGLFVKTTQSMT